MLRLVEYDALRRRLWIFGQRCHHGATGSVVAALACLGMAAPVRDHRPVAAIALAGTALMVHDWKDHEIWFEPGHGSQP
jgi:hypothetical protein